ncbi:MAG: hypothetical protein GF331_24000 [Chitinivibrionales bacterium]|nr:hypothetical protein [Chitinivibrionales bacterium]
MSVLRSLRFTTTALAIAAMLLWSCDGPLPAESAAEYRLAIPSLDAQFVNGKILLNWQAPTGDFDYYRIYRTTETDSLGNPDMSKLVSTLQRDSIDGSLLSFIDQPEPAEGMYYYAIRAVYIDTSGTHEEGALSPVDAQGNVQLVAVQVGYDLRFSINRGKVFTLVPQCSLIVEDPGHVLSSVRFTQIRGESVPTGQPPSLPDDPHDQVRDLAVYGLLTGLSLPPDTGRVNFDIDDPNNPVRTAVYDPARAVHTLPQQWTLLPGAGQKTVFAELTYANGTKDTVVDIIHTEPHRVGLTIRNTIGEDGGTVRDTSETYTKKNVETQVRMLIFYTNDIHFSVKVFGDKAIERDFDYWLLSARDYSTVTELLDSRHWIMTMPRRGMLTAGEGLHSSDTVYSISVDTSAHSNGRETLDSLLVGRWADVDTLYTGNYAEQRRAFDLLLSSSLDGRTDAKARKQFLLVARFRESYFQGSFIRVFGLSGPEGEETRTYRDVYPPLLRFNAGEQNEHHISEGDTIQGPFSFVLDTSSLIDSGMAKITEVKLGVARMPTGFAWDPSTFTLGQFYTLSHELFPFTVEKPQAVIKDVRWDDIDPRDWTSGRYIMGIIYGNERGDEGFAWVWGGSLAGTNPFGVYISTSN